MKNTAISNVMVLFVGLACLPAHPASAQSTASGQGTQASTQATSTHTWRMPTVSVTEKGNTRILPLEKTQLATTKTKPTSMAALTGDSVVAQAMSYGANTVASETAMSMNSGLGSSAMMEGGDVVSNILARRKPMVTYVWGVPSPASANVLQTAIPQFQVDFSHAPGVNPDDYEPTLVKLTPAQNSCRLIGATQGKVDVRSSPSADWEIYSHFVEDRVRANLEKQASGKYKVLPSSELLPGEYAVVLRPVTKTRKFSGGDVARAQGDGFMFDAAWTFQVPDSAQ